MPAPRLPLLDVLLAGEDGPVQRDEAARSGDADASAARASAARTARNALRRDLALLLDTRPRRRSAPPPLTELQTSVLTYGIPDLRTRALSDEAGRAAFRTEIEAQVRRFEPRLSETTVEGPEADGCSLRYRIRAVLRADGEPVAFDVDLDVATRSLSVADASDDGS